MHLLIPVMDVTQNTEGLIDQLQLFLRIVQPKESSMGAEDGKRIF